MNDDLHTFIEPELQARIAALVLGEASEFERDELEKLIAEKPELVIYQRRIQAMHDLLGESVKPAHDPDWQLSREKREKLLQQFSRKGEAEVTRKSTSGSNTVRIQIRAASAIAACVLFTVILFFMATPVMMKQKSAQENVAQAEEKVKGGLDLDEMRHGNDDQDAFWAPTSKNARENSSSIERKPSAPSSSMANVIASATNSRPSVPVPKAAVPAPSVEFGDGDDFGDGWGSGEGKRKGRNSGGGGGGREMAEAESDPFAAPMEEAKAIAKNEIVGNKRVLDRVMRREVLKKRKSGLERDQSVVSQRYSNFRNKEMPDSGVVPALPAGVTKERERLNSVKIVGEVGALLAKDSDEKQSQTGKDSGRYAWTVKPNAPERNGSVTYSDQNGPIDAFARADEPTQGRATSNDLGYSSSGSGTDFSNIAAVTDARSGGIKRDLSTYFEKEGEEAGKKSRGEGFKSWLLSSDSSQANIKHDLIDSNYVTDEAKKADVKFLSGDSGDVTTDTPTDFETRNVINSEKLSYKRNAESDKDKLPIDPALEGMKRTERNLKVDDQSGAQLALTSEHSKKVNDVRKNLYLGEGYYNLGKYDKAEAEMKKVLQKDPYNKAARRWLEKVSNTKSDYYRAAYDQTRAELLMEVDKAWEIAVPPAPEVRTKAGRQVAQVAEPKPTSKPIVTNGKPARPKALPEETLTRAEPFSTFSLNVNDVSFKLARVALLEKGEWPDAAKVRTEEFVNAFDYGDPSPRRGEPVACAIEQSAHPFLQQRNLLRVGMKTAAMGRSQPLRLTVLLDNSGSMEREDREASVLAAMEVLAAQLNPQDVITVVSFARQPRLIADRVPGHQAAKLVDLVAKIPSEGGTNLEEALRLARTLAKRQHTEGAQSRVVLITDGVANLGNTVPEQLSNEVETMRQQGIAFDACGVGAEGLNDDILEALTRKGDGRYYFLNRPEDADAGFVKQLAGALTPAAKNVKVQVVFNPKRVARYRLLGFEKHLLNKEDFRNDKVDAAEMAAEEAGNAVYQIQVNPQGEGELGEVFVRFLDASTGRMVERSWPLAYEPQAKPFDLATPSMQLAGTAAMLGEKLHGTDAGSVRFSTISDTLGKIKAHYASDTKVQDLIRMCRKTE